jgi:hypothetical protein
MKKLTLLFCLFSFICLKGFSQSQLYGEWNVNCGVTGVDEGKPKCCEICPVDMHKDGKSSWKVSGFYMTFTKDSLRIEMPSEKKVQTVSYTWDSKTSGLSFSFDGKKYRFKVEEDPKQKGKYMLSDDKDYTLFLDKRKMK